ncbi:MAG: PRC-barrel domain-containing protein [Pseudomonas sp.]
MLRSMHDLKDYTIGAIDGDIGKVKDFYFDDEAWVIRYFIVDTGAWLSSRKVLISPLSIQHPDWTSHRLAVAITKEQVENSPNIDTDKPVSRQHEIEYFGYYGYQYYWGGPGMWNTGLYPDSFGTPSERAEEERVREESVKAERARHRDDDPHLRSCKAVIGYHIKAIDGEVGHVEDVLINEQTWAIQYLVVNTSNWWRGHKILMAPEWIGEVNWPDKTVSVELNRASIEASPPYDSSEQLNREQELNLRNHYGRSASWMIETVIERAK